MAAKLTGKLTGAKRKAALKTLKGWKLQDGRDAIEKSYTFENFVTAFGFMSSAALVAQQLDHHPEWFNVYNRVDVVLSTHDANGLTQLDIDLAEAMDGLAKGRTKKPK